MRVYTGEGLDDSKRKLQALPIDDLSEVEPRKRSILAGLEALTTGCLSRTSAHGLPRVVSEHSLIRKFAWLVIFVVASMMFCVMMHHACVEYFSRPVNINIKYKVRTEAEFPAVTVCNLNPLKKSKLNGTQYQSLKDIDEKYGAEITRYLAVLNSRRNNAASTNNNQPDNGGTSAASSDNNQPDTQLQTPQPEQSNSRDSMLQTSDLINNTASDTDFETFMKYSQTEDYSDITDLLKPTMEDLDAYGHEAKRLIRQCSFDKTSCTYLNFTKVYNSRYGNCFVFNLNATKTSLYGSKYGLRLTLDVEPQDYIGLLSHENGVRVAVHAANVTAFPEDEGVNAPTEGATSIGVTTSTFTRLPAPYTSMCADGSNHTLLDKGEYTVWACSLACLQSNLKKDCDCSDRVGLPKSEKRCSITNTAQEACRQRIYNLYNEGQLGCYCPQPCNQVQYNTKVSMTMWPSLPYMSILKDRMLNDLVSMGFPTIAKAKSALARVHVYMEDLTIHSTEEYAAFTLGDLFANIGGYLGLFIGISACTVMEFFEFLMDTVGYAIVTMFRGYFVRVVQQINTKPGLTVTSAPVEAKQLPPEPMHNISKPRIFHVVPLADAEAVGFNPQVHTLC